MIKSPSRTLALALPSLLLASAVSHAQTTPPPPDKLAAIEKAVESSRQELHVPGAALAIVKDGRVIFSKGFGYRDLQRKLPVTSHTRFAIGSCTKAFTGMAAEISQDQGKLSLTDSPRKFLPYFKVGDPDLTAKVTLADMLSHRTGMMAYGDVAWFTGVLGPEEVIRSLANAKPTAKLADKRFQYSNVMFLAAGECVAAAQHSSYDRTIHRLIFQPLGMTESDLSSYEALRSKDHATGYDLPDRKTPRKLAMRHLDNIAPAGAIDSTASDMAKWVEVMLGEGALGSKRIVSEKGFKDLVTPHTPTGPNNAYAYGWVIDSWHGHKRIWHNGGIDGFNAHLAMLPEEHLGFILLTNISESNLPDATMEAVFSNLTTAPVAKVSKEATPKDDNPAGEAGLYRLGDPNGKRTLDISIAFRENHLWAHPKGQPEFQLKLIGDRRYGLEPPAPADIFISFRPTKADPSKTELVLEQSGVTIIGAPVASEPFVAAISVDQLMSKALDARGGAAALGAHKTLEITMSLDMVNQGVTGTSHIFRNLPNAIAEVDELRAVGKSLGLIHEFYDGHAGRTEATFIAPDLHTGKDLVDAALHADFAADLNWKTRYKSVTIDKMDKVDGEDVYVVKKAPAGGSELVDYVSTQSFRLLKRDWPGNISETYRDYRSIGGILLPYEIERADINGKTILKVTRVAFDKPTPSRAFKPGYPGCRL